jgi:hypothetical protein
MGSLPDEVEIRLGAFPTTFGEYDSSRLNTSCKSAPTQA